MVMPPVFGKEIYVVSNSSLYGKNHEIGLSFFMCCFTDGRRFDW